MNAAGPEVLRSRYPLLDRIQVAFLLTDVHSKVLYVNRKTERLFGYGKEELEGQRMRVLFLEEDQIYFLPNIVYLTLYKEGFDGEALLRQKDGSKIFVHLFTASFREEGEVFLAFSFQEIHHLKKLEKDRLEAERWAGVGKMVEEIAHQIRNPIVSIGGYTKRLAKEIKPSKKAGGYLDRILQETGRLETIIKRVEDYVNIPNPAYHRESLREVVESALQQFSGEVRQKDVSVSLQTGRFIDGGYLFIDKGLMVNALCHLLRNSLETLDPAKTRSRAKIIKVALLEEGETFGVSVSDRGEGIPRRNLDLIFEPFFSTRPDHVGLGLTFVKRVMEEHGGKIRVESHRGKGTTMTLTFPKDRRRRVRREFIAPDVAFRREG